MGALVGSHPCRGGRGDLRVAALAAATAGVAPSRATAAALEFDGQMAARSLATGEAQLTGRDLGTIGFAVAPRWAPQAGTPAPGGGAYAQPDATLVSLWAADDLLIIGLGKDETHIEFMNADADVQVFEVGALASGGPVAIAVSHVAAGGWSIAHGATPLGALPPGFFDPAPAEPVQVEVGGTAFVGVIDGFRIASDAGATVVKVDAGGELALMKVFNPRLGIYRQNDARFEFDASGRRDGIVYPRIRYFALVERDGQLGLVFDWAVFSRWRPIRRCRAATCPRMPASHGPGRSPSTNSNDRYFTASGVAQDYRPVVPLLENGKKYGWWKSLAEQPYARTNTVSLGSAFAQNAPSDFYLSVDGCYDLTDMDRGDFTQTGCQAPLFTLPPMELAAYRAGGEHGEIIPFGWQYKIRSDAYGNEFSSLVEIGLRGGERLLANPGHRPERRVPGFRDRQLAAGHQQPRSTGDSAEQEGRDRPAEHRHQPRHRRRLGRGSPPPLLHQAGAADDAGRDAARLLRR